MTREDWVGPSPVTGITEQVYRYKETNETGVYFVAEDANHLEIDRCMLEPLGKRKQELDDDTKKQEARHKAEQDRENELKNLKVKYKEGTLTQADRDRMLSLALNLDLLP